MSDLNPPLGRAARLDRALADLLAQAPELEAAAVVSFDGLAMASRLPSGMDEDRVAAMSAALLSLGEKAADGLGRGDLSQVYVEGESGTVFLISADDEAVLVAVAAAGAKAGLMLFEVRRAAAVVGEILKHDEAPEALAPVDRTAIAEAEAAYQAYRATHAATAPMPPVATPAPVLPSVPVSPLLVPVPPADPVPAASTAPWEPYAAPSAPTWS